MRLKLIHPTLVPIKLLTKLAAAGLDTTEKVHTAIIRETLQDYPGIGQATEIKILEYYTDNSENPQQNHRS